MIIRDILKGTKPGRIQSVGYMQVIPLVSDLVDDSYSTFEDISMSTKGYGTVVVENEGDQNSILPFASSWVVKQAAQDHSVPTTKILKAGQSATINTAACIQASQGGYIKKGKHRIFILPWSIKETAFDTREKVEYSKLWPAITEFNKSLKLSKGGHLEYFVKNFQNQLDEFIAEFEIIHKQIGAIILVDGKVVGVERAPNYRYWKDIWNPLIREGYGSLVLQHRVNDVRIPENRIPLPKNIRSLKGLKSALEKVEGEEEKKTKEIIDKFVDSTFTVDKEERVGTLEVNSVTNEQFKGQIVKDGEKVVYASLFTTSAWIKNADWRDADEFKM